jgi:hypothetical protein
MRVKTLQSRRKLNNKKILSLIQERVVLRIDFLEKTTFIDEQDGDKRNSSKA